MTTEELLAAQEADGARFDALLASDDLHAADVVLDRIRHRSRLIAEQVTR